MTRTQTTDYTGASGRIDRSSLTKLSRRWVVQPKLDGMYLELHLDHRGAIDFGVSRTGRRVDADELGDLAGCVVGGPGAVVAGEWEAHTEAGNRAATERGWRLVHLFDCLHAPGGWYIGHEPYHVRRDALWKMQAPLMDSTPAPYYYDRNGRVHNSLSGDFCLSITRDWRRCPIVPQVQPRAADSLWQDVTTGDLEGLVAVNLDAPVGRRGAKRKCKPVRDIDCEVVGVWEKRVRVVYDGIVFQVGRCNLDVKVGDIVEVRFDGQWYESTGKPKFARIHRVRTDMLH